MNQEPIDLDALRASRPELANIPVLLGGVEYTVPARLTVALGLAAIAGDLAGLVQGLFGADAAAVLASDPPLEVADLLAIVQRLAGGPGNLPGSIGSAPGGRT